MSVLLVIVSFFLIIFINSILRKVKTPADAIAKPASKNHTSKVREALL